MRPEHSRARRVRGAVTCIAAAAVVSFAVLLGCEGPPTQRSSRCESGRLSRAVQAADRKLLGEAARYSADGMLRERDDELRASKLARRTVGWATAAKVLRGVPLNVPLTSDVPATVPAWQTYYGGDDMLRLFQRLYVDLGVDGRRSRARFSDLSVDEAFGWNTVAVEGLDNWPAERWRAYVDAIDEDTEVVGIGGLSRVVYSSAAARQLLVSYPQMLECLASGTPADFVDALPEKERTMARLAVRMDACTSRTFGPYFVASGETLSARFEGMGEGRLSVRTERGGEDLCGVRAPRACEVAGPGRFYVEVASEPEGLQGAISIDYRQPAAPWSACLDGAFAADAVVVKAEWQRAQFDRLLPTFDTSAAAMSRRLAGDADWGEGDGTADPGPEDIHTMKLANGNIYRLAALHIMTKELDHWVWTTLWWSPEPDTDFGADRPDSIRQLEGPWSHYKMCIATAFDEADTDPRGGAEGSLGDALAATHGASSWCSNPYLELGHGNASTNCIGCHQHAGTGLRSEEILADPRTYPDFGRALLRNNFPSDYSFAVDAGDRLSRTFADVVEYYDGFE